MKLPAAAAALLALTAPAALAAAPAGPALAALPDGGVLEVWEDDLGAVHARWLPAAPEHDASCGGIAPVDTACGTGPHTENRAYVHGFRVTLPPLPAGTYTGTVTSTISNGAQTRVFTCSFAMGLAPVLPAIFDGPPVVGCSGVGVKPDPASTFVQRCSSNMPGASFTGLIAGGVGQWACYVGPPV